MYMEHIYSIHKAFKNYDLSLMHIKIPVMDRVGVCVTCAVGASKALLCEAHGVHNGSGLKGIALHCLCVLEPVCNSVCSFYSFPLVTARILNWHIYCIVLSGSFFCRCLLLDTYQLFLKKLFSFFLFATK